ncbi:MAG TPA: hypothetical protein VMI54_19470 [Polyangiaceae bacterium]|nr:hypothetical protein [Polyangiaceae bacterium]
MRLGLALGVVVLSSVTVAAEAHPTRQSDPPRAAAAAPVLELLVLYATNQKKGIDPRVRDLSELTRPPFASYDSYALLERVRLPLATERQQTHRLPNGRVLGAALVENPSDDSVRLSASISEPGGRAFLPLLEVRARVGQRFIVAGQKYESGILVLVLAIAR